MRPLGGLCSACPRGAARARRRVRQGGGLPSRRPPRAVRGVPGTHGRGGRTGPRGRRDPAGPARRSCTDLPPAPARACRRAEPAGRPTPVTDGPAKGTPRGPPRGPRHHPSGPQVPAGGSGRPRPATRDGRGPVRPARRRRGRAPPQRPRGARDGGSRRRTPGAPGPFTTSRGVLRPAAGHRGPLPGRTGALRTGPATPPGARRGRACGARGIAAGVPCNNPGPGVRPALRDVVRPGPAAARGRQCGTQLPTLVCQLNGSGLRERRRPAACGHRKTRSLATGDAPATGHLER